MEFMFLAVGIIFVAAFIIIGIGMAKSVAQWNKNNKSPRLTVTAKVVSKRINVSHYNHDMGNGAMGTSSSTDYYVTFEVESGDRMELHVNGREYGVLAEGDYGSLTFQGTRFIGFDRV